MKPCFGYIRVSTQKQGAGVSLDTQKDAITAFASRHDLYVTRWFTEKETAAKSGRPVFNQMLTLLRRGRARGLIMHKIDRSARNLKDWAIVSELPDAGVDVYIATESVDFRSRGGRLTADIQAVIAADYIRNLRDETIKGLTGRLKQGLYPFRAPIGYRDNGRGRPKTLCPVKAPLVRDAFTLYASGTHSLRSLQAELARRGLRNHAGNPLSLHGVEALLRNPFYTGLIEIRRSATLYPGIHEPLVDRKTFARVQDVRAGRAGKKVTRHDHAYRGLFRCGLCGGPMTPEIQKAHVYYRCQRRGCATKTVREDVLDEQIQSRLQSLTLAPEDAAQLRADWLAWLHGDERGAATRSRDLRIATLHQRLDRLTDLLLDGALDRAEYDRRKRSLMLELHQLEDEARKHPTGELSEVQIEKYLELLTSLARLHILVNPPEKRCLVENAFSNRTVSEKTVELEPSIWLTERKFAELSPMVTLRGIEPRFPP